MTEKDKAEMREWHEGVIAKYPPEIQTELRDALTKWLAGVRKPNRDSSKEKDIR
jgi:hypothetical protein